MTVAEGADLIGLVDLLEPTGVALLVPPGGTTRVRGGHLHDGTLPSEPGHLVIAVGVPGDDPSLLGLCDEAAVTGQTALAVKARGGDLRALRERAAAAGLGLMVFPDAVPWSDVYSVVAAAVSSDPSVGTQDFGEDLFALADSISGLFGTSVAIEDLSQTVVGYSSLPGQLIDEVRIAGILGRRVPQSAASTEQYQLVYAADGVVRFPRMDGEQPRAAIAIRAGALPLGSIWALESAGVESGEELDPECVRALERGAQLAARHLMRAHDAHEPQARQRRSVLDALLAQQPVSRGDLAALADSDVLTVSALATLDASSQRTAEIARLVARQYRALRPRSVVSTGEDAVYVLTPGDDPDAARRITQDVLATVQASMRTPLCGAVSSAYAAPTELPTARAEVDDVVRCLRSLGGALAVATLGDVRGRLVLLSWADRIADDPRLAHPGVQAMREGDAAETYWPTVLAWLDGGCSVPAAARALHVHENTVRYRLARLPELFHLDLDDPEVRLAVWMQMRAHAAGDADGRRAARPSAPTAALRTR